MTDQDRAHNWIDQSINHVRFWLRFIGKDAKQRRQFFLDLAAEEERDGEGDTWLSRPLENRTLRA